MWCGLEPGSLCHWPTQSLPGDGPVLDMLLEATLIGEDLVADVAVLLLPGEQEPEEAAIDPAHKAWQKSAGGEGQGDTQELHYPAFGGCQLCARRGAEFFPNQGLIPTPAAPHAYLQPGNPSGSVSTASNTLSLVHGEPTSYPTTPPSTAMLISVLGLVFLHS